MRTVHRAFGEDMDGLLPPVAVAYCPDCANTQFDHGPDVVRGRKDRCGVGGASTFLKTKGDGMAKKTVRVSDMSGEEIPDGRGATVRITFADARRGSRELDLTDAEAEKLGGRQVARRGRRPKSAS